MTHSSKLPARTIVGTAIVAAPLFALACNAVLGISGDVRDDVPDATIVLPETERRLGATTFTPAEIDLVQGGAFELRVKVEAGTAGIASVTLEGLPAGVHGPDAPLSLPGGTEGTLPLSADTFAAAFEGSVRLVVRAENVAEQSIALPLRVRAIFDPTFGDGGAVLLPARSELTDLGLLVAGDGRITVVSTNGIGAVGDQTTMSIQRLTANGAPDESAGPGGTFVFDAGAGTEGTAAAILGDGRRIAFGSRSEGSDPRLSIAVDVTTPSATPPTGAANRLTAAGAERVIHARPVGDAGAVLLVERPLKSAVRYAGDTTQLDESMGASIPLILNAPNARGFVGKDFVTQDAGILVVGVVTPLSGSDVGGVVRFPFGSGASDPSFGTDGSLLFDGSIDTFRCCDLDEEGRLVAAGQAAKADPLAIRLARVGATGQRDPTFGDSGVADVPLSEPAAPVALLARGDKVLIAGSVRPLLPNMRPLLARLDRSGRLDPTFGDRGTVIVGIEPALARRLAPQGDRVIVAVLKKDFNGTYTVLLVRLLP